jgi:hypothetical protein
MWRQASLPAVEGGILPPGKNVHLSKRSYFTMAFPVATQFRRAGSHGSTSAKMADATIFRQALKTERETWPRKSTEGAKKQKQKFRKQKTGQALVSVFCFPHFHFGFSSLPESCAQAEQRFFQKIIGGVRGQQGG